jgi:hypothetical protein
MSDQERPGSDGPPEDHERPPKSRGEDEVEQAEKEDPDAPALGAVDDGEQVPDPPEPQEPG